MQPAVPLVAQPVAPVVVQAVAVAATAPSAEDVAKNGGARP